MPPFELIHNVYRKKIYSWLIFKRGFKYIYVKVQMLWYKSTIFSDSHILKIFNYNTCWPYLMVLLIVYRIVIFFINLENWRFLKRDNTFALLVKFSLAVFLEISCVLYRIWIWLLMKLCDWYEANQFQPLELIHHIQWSHTNNVNYLSQSNCGSKTDPRRCSELSSSHSMISSSLAFPKGAFLSVYRVHEQGELASLKYPHCPEQSIDSVQCLPRRQGCISRN